MKLIFLDIDGVLCMGHKTGDHDTLEVPLMKKVKRIIDETGALVILSSDWRCRSDWFISAKKQLKEVGIHIHDITPDHEWSGNWESNIQFPEQPHRAGEILAFLESFPDEVEQFAVIDDDDFAKIKGHEDKFFHVNCDTGITDALTKRIIEKLTKERSKL